MELKELESAVESILFVAGEPVEAEHICRALEVDRQTLDAVCQRMAGQYQYERRGIRLLKLNDAYQMTSAPEHAELIRSIFTQRKRLKLSQAALEVLAVIAYYQPATRAYVDQVRGVDSSYTVNMLLERDLIEECGRLAVPGRPLLYRTTNEFLRSFHLTSLDDLPELPPIDEEEGQIRMEIQSAIDALRAEQARAQDDTAQPEAEQGPV